MFVKIIDIIIKYKCGLFIFLEYLNAMDSHLVIQQLKILYVKKHIQDRWISDWPKLFIKKKENQKPIFFFIIQIIKCINFRKNREPNPKSTNQIKPHHPSQLLSLSHGLLPLVQPPTAAGGCVRHLSLLRPPRGARLPRLCLRPWPLGRRDGGRKARRRRRRRRSRGEAKEK